MKTKTNPAVVGAFVIGALVLAMVGLLSFGGVNLFVRPERFVAYFNESVHGLDLGSPVKLGGVRVGRVVDLHIRYDARTNESVAEVVCELNKDTIRDASGAVLDVTEKGRLEELVRRGLRAELDVGSLATGLLFVELDFRNPRDYPPEPPPGPSPYLVVPSVPSFISEFQKNLTDLLGRLNAVDFQGLSNNLMALFADARRQLDAMDLPGVARQWREAGSAVKGAARSPEIPKALADADAAFVAMRSALVELRSTLGTAKAQVGTNGQDLQATLARAQAALGEFQAAAATLRQFLVSQQDVGGNLTQALDHLSEAADSVRRLADFLQRYPNALIVGRKAAP